LRDVPLFDWTFRFFDCWTDLLKAPGLDDSLAFAFAGFGSQRGIGISIEQFFSDKEMVCFFLHSSIAGYGQSIVLGTSKSAAQGKQSQGCQGEAS
jgi:hypothetical protein